MHKILIICFSLYPIFTSGQLIVNEEINLWEENTIEILREQKISFMQYRYYIRDSFGVSLNKSIFIYEKPSNGKSKVYRINNYGDTLMILGEQANRFKTLKFQLKSMPSSQCRHYLAFAEATGLNAPPGSHQFNLNYRNREWGIVFAQYNEKSLDKYGYDFLHKIPLLKFNCMNPFINLKTRRLVRKLVKSLKLDS